VVKLNPTVTQYLYLAYLDSAASDQVTAIAVDSLDNAYVAGSTTNSNFPSVGVAALGTAPTSSTDTRSFVTKLNPDGAVVFSVLIGGSATSTANGIALTPRGQILVSGTAASDGFPTTPGACTVANSANQWFLMELNAAASSMIFSATGVGGSSIVLDAGGNIYMSGSSVGTNYPTTPGAYQTTFTQGYYCFGFCQISFPGNLQHVTKVDPSASKLIYSTGLNNTSGAAGSTTTTGLA
jgi:Beta-propeller repeat